MTERAPDGRGRRRLDEAIDAALREMVAGKGPADLRARVLARLAEEPGRPRQLSWPLLAAAAVMAGVAVTVALTRTGPAPEAGPRHASAPAAAPLAKATPSPSLEVPVAAGAETTLLARPRTRRSGRQAEAAGTPAAARSDAAMGGAGVEPIAVAHLNVVPISEERVAVTALSFARMEIEPLAEPQP